MMLICLLCFTWGQHSYDRYRLDSDQEDVYDFDDAPRIRKKFDTTPIDYSQTNAPKKIRSAFRRYLSPGKIAKSLNLPRTEEGLLNWDMINHDDKKEKLIEDTTDHMCQFIERDYNHFCPAHITLVERLAAGEYHNVKLAELKKLSQYIEETLDSKHKKIKNLKNKMKKLEVQMPKQHKALLQSNNDMQDQSKKIDEKIKFLQKQSSKDIYDNKKIQNLEEEKELLLEDFNVLKQDFDQKRKTLDKMKAQAHQLEENIDHLEMLSRKIDQEVNSREESQDLALAWDEMGDLWSKHADNERQQKEYKLKLEQEAFKEKANREKQEKDQENKEKESLMTMANRFKTDAGAQSDGQVSGFGLDSLFKIIPDVLPQ